MDQTRPSHLLFDTNMKQTGISKDSKTKKKRKKKRKKCDYLNRMDSK